MCVCKLESAAVDMENIQVGDVRVFRLSSVLYDDRGTPVTVMSVRLGYMSVSKSELFGDNHHGRF